MKNKSNRRSFLKKVGAVGATAAAVPVTFAEVTEDKKHLSKELYSPKQQQENKRAYNEAYYGAYNNRIAFPIGGMGTGMFCMEGTGAISHMSIRHKPDLFSEPSMFAAISIKGLEKGAKVLEGPVPDWKKFGQKGAGNGMGGNTYGLPRFNDVSFEARFPFGIMHLKDEDIPLEIKVTGWNPFIPNDPDNSSLPVGGFEYQLKNTSNQSLEGTFSYNSKNFLTERGGTNSINKLKNGFILSEKGTDDKPSLKADFAIACNEPGTVVDYCWFRGGWWDPLTMIWDTIKSGKLKKVNPVEKDAPGASIYIPFKIDPNQEKTIRVVMAWYVPDSDLKYGNDEGAEKNTKCDPASGCCNSPSDKGLDPNDKDFSGDNYKPWYSSKFNNVEAVIQYFGSNYDDLLKKSMAFTESFYSSTLPDEVVEAVAANLTILKSPTVMRQYDGRLWNYEGCGDNWGCCPIYGKKPAVY
jgi:uncharacterized protein (DUF608 family)